MGINLEPFESQNEDEPEREVLVLYTSDVIANVQARVARSYREGSHQCFNTKRLHVGQQ